MSKRLDRIVTSFLIAALLLLAAAVLFTSCRTSKSSKAKTSYQVDSSNQEKVATNSGSRLDSLHKATKLDSIERQEWWDYERTIIVQELPFDQQPWIFGKPTRITTTHERGTGRSQESKLSKEVQETELQKLDTLSATKEKNTHLQASGTSQAKKKETSGGFSGPVWTLGLLFIVPIFIFLHSHPTAWSRLVALLFRRKKNTAG